MQENDAQFLAAFPPERVLREEPLAKHTYMKIGGPADLFLTATHLDELKQAVNLARMLSIPFFILGGGSNILVGDKGIRGLVIKNRCDRILIDGFTGKVIGETARVSRARVTAESGIVTNLLVRRTIEAGLAGLQYFLGVPGTLGGAVYNNSHYKDQLIGNLVEGVTVLTEDGEEKNYAQSELEFAYNYSLLQQTHEVILRAQFELPGGDRNKLWEEAETFAKTRSTTQPLNQPSSGCIFKNVQQKPLYPDSQKGDKLSAGWLIEKSGVKGQKVGGAMVSPKHANFIVNTGGATAKDVLELVEIVEEKVKEKFGVSLEMEVFKVGEF